MAGLPGLETLFVRLYFDRHIMARLAVDLRGRGFDVLTTEDAGNDMATDEAQLAFATATAAGRSILTFNIRDFAPLHKQRQAAGEPHAGTIVSQQLGRKEYGLLLPRMLRLLNQLSSDEMLNNFVHLEQFR